MSRGYGKITIDLNDLGSAIRELNAAKAWVKDCCDELPRVLAEEGKEIASTIFQSVPSNEQGSTTAVSIEEAPNDYTIMATGESAAFIEFGTGALTSPYPVEKSDIPIGPAEWSKRNAMEFYERGYWYYGGQRWMGTGAYRPMMNAGQVIRNDTVKKAKEVFNQ